MTDPWTVGPTLILAGMVAPVAIVALGIAAGDIARHLTDRYYHWRHR